MKLSEIGKKGNMIEEEIGLNIDDVLNKLTQELGEFNDSIQKFRGRYCKTKDDDTNKIKEEVGDLFFNIISLCNRLGLNPDELPGWAENTLNKFFDRKKLYIYSIKKGK